MKKILLVEDDKTLQAVLTRYLEKRVYSVRVVNSGVQGLKLFAQDPPDLVVSDIMMPRMDGLEFCRRLRATRPGQLVPFIFLTAKKDLEDRIQGHYIGADDYITKPFEPLELLAKIEAQLERSRPIRLLDRTFSGVAQRSPSISATLATDLEANNLAAPVPSSQIAGIIGLSGTMTSIQKYSQIAICADVTSAKNCSDSLPSLSWLYSCMWEHVHKQAIAI